MLTGKSGFGAAVVVGSMVKSCRVATEWEEERPLVPLPNRLGPVKHMSPTTHRSGAVWLVVVGVSG